MNPQQPFFLTLKALWQESSRWRNLVLAALVCSVMAVMFHPVGTGRQQNSYNPPSQAAGRPTPPPVPTGDASAPPLPPPPAPTTASPGTSAQPPQAARSPQTLTVVAPATVKIKPGQKGSVAIETQQRDDSDFGRGGESRSTTIKPGIPASGE